MSHRAAAALGVRADDPSIAGEPHDPFAPGLRHPPMDWFFEPPDWFDDATKIWIDSDGRAAGWYYHAGVCIIDGNEGECWTPSPSPTGNELFHQGSVISMDADGTPTILEVGVIGGGGEHAAAWMSPEAAADYYADVTKQLLIGRIYDDPNRGGFFLGCVLASITNSQVDLVRRSALSGDWRWRRQDLAGHSLNAYDAIGPWLVTRPGLPLDRMGRTVMRLASPSTDMPVMIGAICGPLDVEREIPGFDGAGNYDQGEEVEPMWHIEKSGEKFAVIESRSGKLCATTDTADEANAALASMYDPQTAAAADDQGAHEMSDQSGNVQTAAAPPPPAEAAAPPPPPAPPAAPDASGELASRLDALESRVADLEAALSELMTSELQVDDIMPDEIMPGA